MSATIRTDLDMRLDAIEAKIDLVADYLGLDFEYQWDEIPSGVKEQEKP